MVNPGVDVKITSVAISTDKVLILALIFRCGIWRKNSHTPLFFSMLIIEMAK